MSGELRRVGDTGSARGAAAADSSARTRILGRIRVALEARAPIAHPGAAPVAAAEGAEPVELFATTFAQAGGEVVRLRDSAAASTWLNGFTQAFSSAVVSRWLPRPLWPPLPEAEPARAELGVSLAVVAAAATGTLILSSAEGRALQLLPPTHLVWVEEQNVFVELEEALERARRSELPAALALHSGPSKSADIGRIVVTGVHGPGRVIAALVGFPLRELR